MLILLHILCDIMCVWIFGKPAYCSKQVLLTFISCNNIRYCVIWISYCKTKHAAYSCCDCFLENGFLLMLYKMVSFIIVYDIVPVRPFFDAQKRWRLAKKFFHINFRSFTPCHCMIFDDSNRKRLISPERTCWVKKVDHSEICCF